MKLILAIFDILLSILDLFLVTTLITMTPFNNNFIIVLVGIVIILIICSILSSVVETILDKTTFTLYK